MPKFAKVGVDWLNTSHIVALRQFGLEEGRPRRVQVILALHSSQLPRELIAEGEEAEALLGFVRANLAG